MRSTFLFAEIEMGGAVPQKIFWLVMLASFILIASGFRGLAWLNKEEERRTKSRFGWLPLCYLNLAMLIGDPYPGDPTLTMTAEVFNSVCCLPSTPYCAARTCALFTIAICAPSSNINCSVQALSIKIAKCCVKGINMAHNDSMLCIRHHMAQYHCIMHVSIIIYIYIWLTAVHPCLNVTKHQYVAQCCASGINNN